MDFLIKQSVKIHTLTDLYRELAKRVEVLEKPSIE